ARWGRSSSASFCIGIILSPSALRWALHPARIPRNADQSVSVAPAIVNAGADKGNTKGQAKGARMATRRIGSENSVTRTALMDGVETVMRELGYGALTARSVAE